MPKEEEPKLAIFDDKFLINELRERVITGPKNPPDLHQDLLRYLNQLDEGTSRLEAKANRNRLALREAQRVAVLREAALKNDSAESKEREKAHVKQIADLRVKNNALAEKLQIETGAVEEVGQLRDKVDSLEIDSAKMREEHWHSSQAARTLLTQLQHDIRALRTAKAKVEEEVSKAKAEMESLVAERTVLEQENHNLDDAIRKLEDQCDHLNDENNDLQKLVQEGGHGNELCRNKLAEAEKQNQLLKRDMKAAEARVVTIRKEKEAAMDHCKRIESTAHSALRGGEQGRFNGVELALTGGTIMVLAVLLACYLRSV